MDLWKICTSCRGQDGAVNKYCCIEWDGNKEMVMKLDQLNVMQK